MYVIVLENNHFNPPWYHLSSGGEQGSGVGPSCCGVVSLARARRGQDRRDGASRADAGLDLGPKQACIQFIENLCEYNFSTTTVHLDFIVFFLDQPLVIFFIFSNYFDCFLSVFQHCGVFQTKMQNTRKPIFLLQSFTICGIQCFHTYVVCKAVSRPLPVPTPPPILSWPSAGSSPPRGVSGEWC